MAGRRGSRDQRLDGRTVKKILVGAAGMKNLPNYPSNFWPSDCWSQANHHLNIEKEHERMKSTVSSPIASSFADLALTTRVRGALHSDPRTRQCGIEVECVDGTVTLSGEVPKAETALRAQQLALAVGGVDLVHTDIKWVQEPLIKV